jgi:hypothetical protein
MDTSETTFSNVYSESAQLLMWASTCQLQTQQTPWSIIFLEKLIVSKKVKKCHLSSPSNGNTKMPVIHRKAPDKFLFCAHTELHFLTLPSSLSKALPILKRTSTRRTSEHCLGTFRPHPGCIVSHYYPHFLFSVSLSLSQFQALGQNIAFPNYEIPY